MSYDYLIRMQLYSLTKEKVDELVALRDAKREQLEALVQKTEINLWEEDLEAFEKQYYKVYPDSKKKTRKAKSPKSTKSSKNKVIKVLKGSNKTDVKPVLKKSKKIKIKKKIVISPTNKE